MKNNSFFKVPESFLFNFRNDSLKKFSIDPAPQKKI